MAFFLALIGLASFCRKMNRKECLMLLSKTTFLNTIKSSSLVASKKYNGSQSPIKSKNKFEFEICPPIQNTNEAIGADSPVKVPRTENGPMERGFAKSVSLETKTWISHQLKLPLKAANILTEARSRMEPSEISVEKLKSWSSYCSARTMLFLIRSWARCKQIAIEAYEMDKKAKRDRREYLEEIQKLADKISEKKMRRIPGENDSPSKF